jgi:hypothetical protein
MSARSSSLLKTSGEFCPPLMALSDEFCGMAIDWYGGLVRTRLEEMEATVKVMDNASKINDWVAINNGQFIAVDQCSMRFSTADRSIS